MTTTITPSRLTYAGLFFVALATLMFEILLTRIFSVTMWYHFAFVAVSVAMFGLTFGAMLVYRFSSYFSVDQTKRRLAAYSLAFAVFVVLGFLTQQSIPFVTDTSTSIISYYAIALNYLAIATPFTLSGICICLVLTRFPAKVSSLYAADLAGAAFGCVALLGLLAFVDGPSAVLFIAAAAGLGAICFAYDQPARRLRTWAICATVTVVLLGAGNSALFHFGKPALRLLWVMGRLEEYPLYERWNSHSRVIARGTPYEASPPVIHGLSNVYPGQPKVRQVMLLIDVIGATVITWFDPKRPEEVDFLKWVAPNLAHYIRPGADVLVVGVGGGQDILSALLFNQKSVKGVEINSAIVEAITRRFAEMSPQLKDPRVTLVNDEGRSYIARDNRKYDIIQFTYVDTFAASSAGAFVLTENGLYTKEAWTTYLDHLTPDGVLTVSHFYFRGLPAQIYRMTALASESLKALGVEHPEQHIVLVRKEEGFDYHGDRGYDDIATILVCRRPFTGEELDILEQRCEQMAFEIIQSPRVTRDPNFAAIARGEEPVELLRAYPVNVSAPTDDSPFFFHTLRLSGIFDPTLRDHGLLTVNYRAIRILGALLVVVAALTLLFILGPLLFAKERPALGPPLPFLIFFTSIGLGFMLIEIAQMQRFSIFLGHPVYGLAVVLFGLLISSGLGSFSTNRLRVESRSTGATACLAILMAIVLIAGLATPSVTEAFRSAPNGVRIALAVAILFPIGFVLGMAFPIGMRCADRAYPAMTAWFWGINGAASVCGSVLAVVISIAYGISGTYWVGAVCYLFAFGAFLRGARAAVRAAHPVSSTDATVERVGAVDPAVRL